MGQEFDRRTFLAGLGGIGLGALLPARETEAQTTAPSPELNQGLPAPESIEYKKPDRPVSCVIIGHGNRGSYYGSMTKQMPDDWKVVGVAEPIKYRNEAAVKRHGIADDSRFDTWERVFDRKKFADVCVISTPDDLHYAPAMAALDMGYDLLLEKPIAMSWQQCKEIHAMAKRRNAIVGVCHVLRYAPYFVQMREVIARGMIGDVVSVQHLEPIEQIHMSHSFVRGIWRNTKIALPIILAKSCHDLDLLCWFIDKPCTRVSAMGSLTYFRKENAPSGAPKMCLDGCPVEKTCAYYAPKVYVTEKLFGTGHIVTEDRSDKGILEALKTSPFGRCVYQTDNDQPDHFVSTMEFAGGATAAFSMEGLTSYGGRRTRVMGTKGDVVGDERTLDVFLFAPRQRIKWDVTKATSGDLGGHGGGDTRMVRNFTQAVSRRDASLLSTDLGRSMESHLIGFKAEESRLKKGQPMEVDLAGDLSV
jgi:predicted dehydrogenase